MDIFRFIRLFLTGMVIAAVIFFVLPFILILVLIAAIFAPARLRSTVFRFRDLKYGGSPDSRNRYSNSNDDVIDVEAHEVHSTPVERLEDRRN